MSKELREQFEEDTGWKHVSHHETALNAKGEERELGDYYYKYSKWLESKLPKEGEPKGAEEFLKLHHYTNGYGIVDDDYEEDITASFFDVVNYMEDYAKQSVEQERKNIRDILPHFLCVHCYEDRDAINEAKNEFITKLKNNQ